MHGANHNIKVLPEYIYKLMLLRIFPEIILYKSQGHELEVCKLQSAQGCRPWGSQIREQMSGPEISSYEKLILGCGLWSGLDCEIKGSGPIMSNF